MVNRGSVIMMWRDAIAPGGACGLTLGEAPKDRIEPEGWLLVRRAI